VTCAIVGTLPGRIEAASRDRAKRKPTQNMAAYEYILAGKILHHRSTRNDNAEAQRMLDRAITLDPKYAHAQMGDKTAAAAHAQEVLSQEPAFTIQGFLSTLH
jgi:hypothetical protein